MPPEHYFQYLFKLKVINMKALMKKLVRDERGVSALEYAILAAAIVGLVILALNSFGSGLVDLFNGLSNEIEVTGTGAVSQK